MTPELTTVLMIASLLVLMAGFPLAFGVGTVGLFFGLLTSGPGFLYMMPIRVMDGVLSEYILAAVPLYIWIYFKLRLKCGWVSSTAAALAALGVYYGLLVHVLDLHIETGWLLSRTLFF